MPPSRKPRTPLRSLPSVAVSCERVKHHDYTEQKEAESRAEVPQVSFTRGLSIRCHFYSWWLKYSFTKMAQILLSTWLRFSLTFTHHPFQRVRLVSALSLVIERLDKIEPFAPWNDSLDLRQKFSLLRPYLRQLVAQGGQTDLLVHGSIIPLLPASCLPGSFSFESPQCGAASPRYYG